jgi:sulfur relay (sulfurtransferase) DsrF/TusC family protein
MTPKRYLFLQRQPPLAAGIDCFDLALTAAAFDQETTLLLLDDGVYWLAAGLPALLSDSVAPILVEAPSLRRRGLGPHLPAGVTPIEADAVAALIAAADVVVGG